MSALLDALHEDFKRVKSDTRSIVELSPEEDYVALEDSIINDCFNGFFRSTLTCDRCHQISTKVDPFRLVSLPISSHASGAGESSSIDLTECVRIFLEEEIMSEQNKFRCEMCARNVTGTKKLELKTLPPCLVFHLKRFQTVGVKCSDDILFPMELDMSPFLEASSSALYDCIAFCSHSGENSTSGHYTTCSRRSFAGVTDWFRFDDSNRPVIVQNIRSDLPNRNAGLRKQLQSDYKNAYLLFYQRR